MSRLFKKITQKNKSGVITNVICNSAKNGLIPQRDFFDKDIANAENTNGYFIIQKNDFVYNPRKSNDAPYGPISTYKHEEDGIVSPLYLCFRPSRDIDVRYFDAYFKSTIWHRYIYFAGDSGARHDRVSIKDENFFAMPVNIPVLPEQQKIADFLSLVDQRIEKQRQLVEVLKRYKRGLFSSIYSAKQLNWKSVCVGDFSKVYGGYAFDSKTYSESGKYNVLTIGNVSGNRYADIESCNAVEEMPVDIQQYQILQPDDLVVSMTGNVGRVSIVNQDDCLLNQRVAKLDIKDSTIREYVYQVLSCSKFEQEMNNVGQGAAQKNIKNSDIENFIFYIPENNTELNTLARLFLGLDNIILKQEQQLAKLMQSKQSLLQQMFI